MEMRYKLNKAQMDLLQAKEKQVAITSGLGGGKSFALQLCCLVTAITYPDALHCYVSLSYRLMKDASIPAFTQFLEECGVNFEYKSSDYMFILEGKTRVIFRSQDSADKMRSVEIGSLFCDELAYFKPSNFKTILGRLRDKKGPRIMRAATTPKGLNFFYDLFVSKANEDRRLIRTSTYDNKHLDPEYIEMLMSNYDSHMLKQELEGDFISTKPDRTYYFYEDAQHIKPVQYDKLFGDVYIGLDFNVSKMTAVICQKCGDGIRVFDELHLENSNTHAMVRALRAKLTALGVQTAIIIPDSTGSARKSCSERSDHDILREAGFKVPGFRNPRRRDRFNNMNSKFEKGLIQVDPRCKYLLNDFRMFADDEEVSNLGHISDACGYVLWHLSPMVKVKIESSRIL